MPDTGLSNQLQQLVGMPASELVLHQPPMLVLDRLLEIGDRFAVCDWRVSADNGFYIPGRGVPAYVGVEYMAQCVAVFGGARGRINGVPPRPGMLLGSRHYHAGVRFFEEGVTYRVESKELVRTDDGMASFECSVLRGSEIIASGRLTVLERQEGGFSGE